MARRLKKTLRSGVRAFWTTLLFGIITLAVLVQLGRAVFPILDDYRSVVEQNLSQRMQVDVRIGAIEAQWEGLRPQLRLFDVDVQNSEGEPIFQVQEVDLEIGLLSTIRDWRLALRTLTFRGLSAAMVQHRSGRWYVQGLGILPEDPERDKFTINDPLDIFLFGRRVELLDTELLFRFRSGLSTDIAIPIIRLENDSDFHRLAAEFSIDKGAQALSLVVEGTGNPRVPEQFDASGFLKLNSFPSEKVLAAFGIANDVLLGEDENVRAPANWRNTGEVDLQLWFEGTSAKGLNWRGDFTVSGVPVVPPVGMEWPQSLHSQFSGRWHPESGWFVDLVGAQLQWQEFAAPAVHARLRGQLGERSELLVSELDIDAWQRVVAEAGLLPERVAAVLNQLAPRGVLRNLIVSRRSAEQGYLQLQAEVEQAGVQAWGGVPKVEGVDGYVEATALGGHVVVASSNGLVLDFPKVYNQPLQLQRAHGNLRWHIDTQKQLVAISSGTLQVSNEDIAASGLLNLRIPFASETDREPELTLAVGVREGAARLHRLLVPYTVPQSLYQWLDGSIKAGSITDAGFIYHGSLKPNTQQARVLQLSVAVADAELKFDASWPALTDASATLILDDENFQVTNLRGRIMGIDISNAQVALKQLPKGRAIDVSADVQGASADALAVLQSSPLLDIVGEQIARWQLGGQFSGDIDVTVPLQADVEGAEQRVRLTFVDNQLLIPQLGLQFNEINGPLSYSSSDGLASGSLAAKLWGQSVQGRLSSHWQGPEKAVQLEFAGQLDSKRLQQWSARPELTFIEGVTAVNGKLTVPVASEEPLHLTANSMLQGVAIDLPQPFYKEAEQTRLLQVALNAYPEAENRAARLEYQLRLAEQAQLALQSQGGAVTGIALGLGEAAPVIQPGRFSINGALAHVDLQAWNEVLQRYQEQQQYREQQPSTKAAISTDSQTQTDLTIDLALALARVQLGEALGFDGVAVSGGQQGEHWQFQVQSPDMVGTYRFGDDQPLQANLSYLRLPAGGEGRDRKERETGEPQGLAGFDMTHVVALDFYCEQLLLGERDLGKWQFNLRPVSGGLIAYGLEANSLGANIGSSSSSSSSSSSGKGAELVWLRSAAGDTTYVSGQVNTRDVSGLLASFGQERVLTSDRATFDVQLQWNDAPDAIGLNKLLGTIALDLHRGRFIRGAQAGENPVVKLLGLLNFDTLARRLRLDFSDLNPEGLGYEHVHGQLAFKQGIIEVDEPLQVDSPASHIQFVGDIDLLQQTVDAQLVTTFPLTGNLTMAAALTGVLPAAVGVFMVGKLFKEQINKVSSIRYSIDGSWSEPKVNVEKVFEDQTDHQPGP